jgi:hypothetical protein
MRSRWTLGLFVAGIATTFTLGASAGFLKSAGGDEPVPGGAMTLPPLPAPAPIVTTADPEPPVTIDARPKLTPSPLPKELDSNDPWASAPAPLAAPRAAKHKPRPLDSDDPWAGSVAERALPALPVAKLDATDPWAGVPSTPREIAAPHNSHDALREAIKRAIDAGDLEKASSLLEVLRSAR